jgi:hypothetical protein
MAPDATAEGFRNCLVLCFVFFLPKNLDPFLGLWTFSELEGASWSIEQVC